MKPSLVFILEADLPYLKSLASAGSDFASTKSAFAARDVPWIVICNNALSERQLRSAPLDGMSGVDVDFLSLPIGPCRLAEAVHRCLQPRSPTTDATGQFPGACVTR